MEAGLKKPVEISGMRLIFGRIAFVLVVSLILLVFLALLTVGSITAAAITALLVITVMYNNSEYLNVKNALSLAFGTRSGFGSDLSCHCDCRGVPLSTFGLKVENYLCALDKAIKADTHPIYERMLVAHLGVAVFKAILLKIRIWYNDRKKPAVEETDATSNYPAVADEKAIQEKLILL